MSPPAGNAELQAFIEAVPPHRRPLFDHLQARLLEVCPDAEVNKASINLRLGDPVPDEDLRDVVRSALGLEPAT